MGSFQLSSLLLLRTLFQPEGSSSTSAQRQRSMARQEHERTGWERLGRSFSHPRKHNRLPLPRDADTLSCCSPKSEAALCLSRSQACCALQGVSKDSDMQIHRQACACCNMEEAAQPRDLAPPVNSYREQAHEKPKSPNILF